MPGVRRPCDAASPALCAPPVSPRGGWFVWRLCLWDRGGLGSRSVAPPHSFPPCGLTRVRGVVAAVSPIWAPSPFGFYIHHCSHCSHFLHDAPRHSGFSHPDTGIHFPLALYPLPAFIPYYFFLVFFLTCTSLALFHLTFPKPLFHFTLQPYPFFTLSLFNFFFFFAVSHQGSPFMTIFSHIDPRGAGLVSGCCLLYCVPSAPRQDFSGWSRNVMALPLLRGPTCKCAG